MTATAMTATAMTDAEAAERAAAILRERGHVKHLLEDPGTGRVCLAGAVNLAVNSLATSGYLFGQGGRQGRRILDACHEILLKRDCDAADGPIHWNNLPETTPEQVEELLLQAAACLQDVDGRR